MARIDISELIVFSVILGLIIYFGRHVNKIALRKENQDSSVKRVANEYWPVDTSTTNDQINSTQVTSCFARVITKRTPGGSEYYIGFEMEDGERIELRVQGSQYGVIIEGDQGMVSFRDGRMVGFDRTGAVPRKA